MAAVGREADALGGRAPGADSRGGGAAFAVMCGPGVGGESDALGGGDGLADGAGGLATGGGGGGGASGVLLCWQPARRANAITANAIRADKPSLDFTIAFPVFGSSLACPRRGQRRPRRTQCDAGRTASPHPLDLGILSLRRRSIFRSRVPPEVGRVPEVGQRKPAPIGCREGPDHEQSASAWTLREDALCLLAPGRDHLRPRLLPGRDGADALGAGDAAAAPRVRTAARPELGLTELAHPSRRTGNVKVKVEPRPISLVTQMRPPWSSMNLRERASPSPVPSAFLSAVPT